MIDKAVMISLPRRATRRVHAQVLQSTHRWPSDWPQIDFVDGIEGVKPLNWHSTAGAYGCLQSHLRELEDAADRSGSTLVLEDDATWGAGLARDWENFRSEVPPYELLLLGGSHISAPIPTGSVDRVVWACLSHAYIVTPLAARVLLRTLRGAHTHLDWEWREAQRSLPTYAPREWLMYQNPAFDSDVS